MREASRTTRSSVAGAAIGRHGFTLVELLVTIAIIGTLVSLMLPAIRGAMAAARAHQCQAHLRKITLDFSVFVDRSFSSDWGDDRGAGGVRLATFIESEYGIDEFWPRGARRSSTLDSGHIMRCAEVAQPLQIGPLPCDSGGLRSPGAISYALNFRLAKSDAPRPMVGFYRLNERVLSYPGVPLAFDLDGPAAVRKGVTTDATYGAPSLDSQGLMSADRYWSPSLRHAGRSNVCFLDGSVQSAHDPLADSSWRWDYQPDRP